MQPSDEFLRKFHQRNPGCTRIAFADGVNSRTGGSSYELLSALAHKGRVLDLGCGDAHLLSLLNETAAGFGLDVSSDELGAALERLPAANLVRAKAQSLPFADDSFSLVLSHFAFHLMSNLEIIVDEVARVLSPGGSFAAIVGGGPRLGDPFELFLELLIQVRRDDQKVPQLGERRGRTDEGLRSLFGRHGAFESAVTIEDFYVDFGGSFDEVWARLSTVYELMHFTAYEIRMLKKRYRLELGSLAAADRIPCTMAIRRVIAQRSWR